MSLRTLEWGKSILDLAARGKGRKLFIQAQRQRTFWGCLPLLYCTGLYEGFLMELADALAASNLRATLKLNRDEEEGLSGLIATTPSADIRAWAGLDLIRLAKKIENQEQEIRRFEAE